MMFKLLWKSPIRKGKFVELGTIDVYSYHLADVKKRLLRLNFHMEKIE